MPAGQPTVARLDVDLTDPLDNAENDVRKRMIVAIGHVAAALYVAIALVSILHHGAVTADIAATLLGACAALSLVSWARSGGNLLLVTNSLLIFGCIVLGAVNWLNHDAEVFGTLFIWYLPIPLVATFLYGKRFGTIWSILVGIQLVAFLIVVETGAHFDDSSADIRGRFLALASAFAFIMLVVISFDRVRRNMAHRLGTTMTELQRSNHALAEAADAADAANEAKSRFLASMSHEIRTPLNGVIGMANVLDGTDLDEQQQRFVDTIETSGTALLAIISDILDLSKIEASEIELERRPFDLIECVEDTLEQVAVLASQQKIDLGYCMDPDVPRCIVGDEARLRQILVNLVNNAVKFTAQGSVRVEVGQQLVTDEGPIVLRFRVIDTGIGIPSGSVSKLFDAFTQADSSTTRRFGGTGLGLTISKSLVELMGGRIAVASREGHGSTFTFTVVAERMPEATPARSPLAGVTALVVAETDHEQTVLAGHLRWLGATSKIMTPETLHVAERDAEGKIVGVDVAIVAWDPGDRDGLDLGVPTITVIDIHDDLASSAPRRITSPILSAQLDSAVRTAVGAIASNPDTTATPTDGATTDGASDSPHAPSGVARQPHAPARVLVAEDDPMNQTVLEYLLESFGYDATVVADGAAAVEAAGTGVYDLVFMDIQLPELDGLSAISQIRDAVDNGTMLRKPWIVVATATGLEYDEHDQASVGIDEWLAKPLRPHSLAGVLDRFEQQRDQQAVSGKTTKARNL